MLRALNGNPPEFGEFVDHRLAAEAAMTAGLHTAKGYLRLVGDRRPVDMADAGLNSLADGTRALQTTIAPCHARIGTTLVRS
jgi:hypothetical protein